MNKILKLMLLFVVTASSCNFYGAAEEIDYTDPKYEFDKRYTGKRSQALAQKANDEIEDNKLAISQSSLKKLEEFEETLTCTALQGCYKHYIEKRKVEIFLGWSLSDKEYTKYLAGEMFENKRLKKELTQTKRQRQVEELRLQAEKETLKRNFREARELRRQKRLIEKQAQIELEQQQLAQEKFQQQYRMKKFLFALRTPNTTSHATCIRRLIRFPNNFLI